MHALAFYVGVPQLIVPDNARAVIADPNRYEPHANDTVPVEHWHGWICDATIADAILDRLLARVHRFTLKGESRRPRGGWNKVGRAAPGRVGGGGSPNKKEEV